MKKAVFFDYDGTLLDSLENLYLCYADFMEGYGLAPSPKEFETLNGPSIYEVVQILKKKYCLSPAKESLYENYKKIIQLHYTNASLFSEVRETLHKLKSFGVSCSLVTSNSKVLTTTSLKNHKIYDYFDHLTFGDEVQKSKPNPEIYSKALEKSGLHRENVLVVEDSQNGVLAAKAAGLDVLLKASEDFEVEGVSKITDLRVLFSFLD